MKYIFIGAAFFLSVTSCNLGSETEKISGDNFFRNEGKGDRMIMSKNAILYKTTIYPDVVSHAYNKDFIIAKQVPEKGNWPPLLGFDLYSRYTRHLQYKKNPGILNEEGYREQKEK